MINQRKIAVVLPAYNAARTLQPTVEEIPRKVVDTILLVDDGSRDDTVPMALALGLSTFVHDANYGYGRNQKTCYNEALKRGADVIVMLHPDYQYTPRLIMSMAAMIAYDVFDVVLGSRILGVGALKGGMPRYKYLSNRVLTFIQNILQGHKLSEYHTGYRAFSAEVLKRLPLMENSDDFVFDNEMLAQIMYCGFRIGEVSCPARYFEEASSINFRRSVRYGFGVLWTACRFRLQKMRLRSFRIFDERGRKLPAVDESENYYAKAHTQAC
jgi:glycosyltransferase involved in cell wall biosynthesis